MLGGSGFLLRQSELKHRNQRTPILLLLVLSILLAPLGIAEAQDSSSPSAPITPTEMRRLADLGVPTAQYMLGQTYEFGKKGVVQNYTEAARWYRRAAEQGDAYAQSSLGFMYVQGIAVPRDLVQAYKWLNLAASRFEVPEKEAYSQLFSESQIEERAGFIQGLKELQQATSKAREVVKRMMTAAEIVEAQRLASAWKPSSEVRRSIRPADIERMSKIVHDAARKSCDRGNQADCAFLNQKH